MSNQLHRDCLPILMFLYIVLHIVLANLILFAALFNAVCLYIFFAIDVGKCVLFSCFVMVH